MASSLALRREGFAIVRISSLRFFAGLRMTPGHAVTLGIAKVSLQMAYYARVSLQLGE